MSLPEYIEYRNRNLKDDVNTVLLDAIMLTLNNEAKDVTTAYSNLSASLYMPSDMESFDFDSVRAIQDRNAPLLSQILRHIFVKHRMTGKERNVAAS